MPLALITGGARRIGALVATKLADSGFDIALHVNTSRDEGEALISKLRGTGVGAELFILDLAKTENIKTMFADIVKSMGTVDLAVNNASVFTYDSPESFDPEIARAQFNINLLAPVEITRCMAENRSRDDQNDCMVLNMLDNKLFNLNPDYFSYTMTKSALKSATEMMAMGFAGKLRINAIAPGVTLPSGDQSLENFTKSRAMSLSGIGASAQDIANTILHLWNTKSINGETIVIDGGQRHMGLNRDVAFLADQQDE